MGEVLRRVKTKEWEWPQKTPQYLSQALCWSPIKVLFTLFLASVLGVCFFGAGNY